MKRDAKFRELNKDLNTNFQETDSVFPVSMQENTQTFSSTYQGSYKPFKAHLAEDEMRMEAKFSETQVIGSGSGKDGEDGGYYVPSVDTLGNLKWKPSKASMPQVSSANIKGKDGYTPVVSISAIKGGHRISITDADGPKTADVINGSDGKNGSNGQDGKDGVTFVPSVDEEGNLSWSNDKGLKNPETVNIKGETQEVRIYNAVLESGSATRYGVTIKGPEICDENGICTSNSGTVWDGADGKPGASMYAFDSENGLSVDGTLDRSYVNVPEGFNVKRGDLLLSANGNVYLVGAETNVYGHVTRWTATFVSSIRGSAGEKGDPGSDGITPHIGENDTGIPATGPAGGQGLPGTPGKDGVDGKDGYTPVKGVDYFDGLPGADGKPGEDGYTPIKGVDYFDGLPGKDGVDGQPGKDGYTPVKGVDYFDGLPGKDGKDGSPGADGQPGKDGYSPVRGKDYWTDADRQEMVAELKRITGIGTLYKGAWIATEATAISQRYTEVIVLPAGTYVINVVCPYCADLESRVCIGFSADVAIGKGNTFIDAAYGATTMLATFTKTTNLCVTSAASNNKATWSYLDRGGIAALRIA